MDEYINRDELLTKALECIRDNAHEGNSFRLCYLIRNFPKADVTPVKRGEWVHIPERSDVGYKVYKCSVCERWLFVDDNDDLNEYKYCFGCGVDMRKE